MIRFVTCCSLMAVLFSFGACGTESGPEETDTTSLAQGLSVQYDATGIHSIDWEGTDVLAGVGGYYIIGSCTGADDENQNVISLGSDGHTLHSPGVCPGAPFSMQFSGTNPILVNISVGPLPVDYRALSVPFDPTMAYFDSFLISSSGYLVGCANTWTAVSGSGGLFSSIPQPCIIPGHGAVGIARISDPPPGWWGEISGSVVTVRRTILSGNIQEAVFVNHPYTHNMELTFHREPMTTQLLPAGSTYTLQEEISFREPGTQSGTEDNAVVVAVDIPTSVTASSTISATVTLRNTGDTTWVEPADHAGGTRLGSLSENVLTWVPGAAGGYSNSPTDQRLFVPGPVAPNQEVTFSFQIQVPASQGSYLYAARMVHDGVAWFGPEVRHSIQVEAGPCGGDPVNACGGCSQLDSQPGTPCGDCGSLVCDGQDALRCDDPGLNECGTCGPVPVEGCPDAGTDAGEAEDAGTVDAGTEDAGTEDAGTEDAGTEDAGTDDAGIEDAGSDAGGSDDELEPGAVGGCACASGQGQAKSEYLALLLLLGVLWHQRLD
ncbi:MAG: hypothetical protein JRF33_14565 [Deltaproteobacteria bacterium]|nr:hypothetical protein [Deltaproteobacteria bacterium]